MKDRNFNCNVIDISLSIERVGAVATAKFSARERRRIRREQSLVIGRINGLEGVRPMGSQREL